MPVVRPFDSLCAVGWLGEPRAGSGALSHSLSAEIAAQRCMGRPQVFHVKSKLVILMSSNVLILILCPVLTLMYNQASVYFRLSKFSSEFQGSSVLIPCIIVLVLRSNVKVFDAFFIIILISIINGKNNITNIIESIVIYINIFFIYYYHIIKNKKFIESNLLIYNLWDTLFVGIVCQIIVFMISLYRIVFSTGFL